jgi:hypothetical protein
VATGVADDDDDDDGVDCDVGAGEEGCVGCDVGADEEIFVGFAVGEEDGVTVDEGVEERGANAGGRVTFFCPLIWIVVKFEIKRARPKILTMMTVTVTPIRNSSPFGGRCERR